MICSNCGKEISETALFCKFCGTQVKIQNTTENEEKEKPASIPTNKSRTKMSSILPVIQNNLWGIVSAVAINIIALCTASSESISKTAILIGLPFSIFTGCFGWIIARKIKEHFEPDAIIYTKTSTLIATKFWWKFGIFLLCSSIGTLIPAAFIQVLFFES